MDTRNVLHDWIENIVSDIRWEYHNALDSLRWKRRRIQHRLAGTLERTTLREILATGRLCDLYFGKPRADADAYLGRPNARSDDNLLLAFEDLEVGFWDYVSRTGVPYVTYFKLPWKFTGSRLALPPNMYIDGFAPCHNTPFAEFVRYLKDNDIGHRIEWYGEPIWQGNQVVDIEDLPIIITDATPEGIATKTIFDDMFHTNATYINRIEGLEAEVRYLQKSYPAKDHSV